MTKVPETPYFMAEMPIDLLGPVVESRLRIGSREIKFVRPGAADQLLNLDSVAAAYQADQYMPYWATIWPVAVHFAGAILARTWPDGIRALELGSGLGLVGTAALLAGIDTTFSDYDATALRFARENAARNGFPSAKTLPLDWRHPLPQHFDLIIASDLTYEERNIGPLVTLFSAMLAPGGMVWLADQNRAYADTLRRSLRDHGWTWRESSFETPAEIGCWSAGGVMVQGTLYEISRAT